jgi:hypothetical protein
MRMAALLVRGWAGALYSQSPIAADVRAVMATVNALYVRVSTLSNINSAVPCHNAARAEYDRSVANGQGPEALAPGSKYGARVQAGRAGIEPAPRRYNSELIGNLGRLGWDIEPYLIN